MARRAAGFSTSYTVMITCLGVVLFCSLFVPQVRAQSSFLATVNQIEPIPDGSPSGLVQEIQLSFPSGTITDLDICLDIEHPFVGNLTVLFEHVDTGTQVKLIDRPGIPATALGCSSNDYAIVLDDEGLGGAIEDLCGADDSSSTPTTGELGNFVPNQLLSVFDGEPVSGLWRLTVVDNAAGRQGRLLSWCFGGPFTPCPIDDTDSDADGELDCSDLCPNDPDKIGPGICGCGQPDSDSDGDGVADCDDGCPNDPNKTDPGDCGCGIPDDDSDGDGIADCNDGCPNDPAKTDPGDCGCGVSDNDSDGDGVADCNDGCPNDPAKTDPGDCGCGVPDSDIDGDGTADCIDDCPNDPNKIGPGVCGCGQPDSDSDGDGVADCIDGCPNDPTKTSPGDCGCGVSDSDTDGDGVADCDDGCPNDPNKVMPEDCGCGARDFDTDTDGISDCLDNCPVTPNGNQADSDGDGTGDVCEPVTAPQPNPPVVNQSDCGDGMCGAGTGMIMMPLMLVGFRWMRRKRIGRGASQRHV